MTVSGRDSMGLGSVIDAHSGDHEGTIKNPTEKRALDGLDNWVPSARKSPLDFFREIAARRQAEREARMKDDGEGHTSPEK